MSAAANAGEIAASFTKFYYELLTKPQSADELVRLYGENSCLNFTSSPNGTVPESCQGKAQIASFYNKMQDELGERKVIIRHLDYVAADANVAVTCSGYLHTRMMIRVFSQTFVLAPTKYRTGCYYIVGDSLRFLSEDVEAIPAGFVSAEEYEALEAERALEQAKEAEAAAAAAAAAALAAAAAAVAPVAAPVRKTKEAAPAPAPVAAPVVAAPKAVAPTEEAPRVRKPHTSSVRIVKVPVDIQLSTVADACARFGTVADRYWLHEVDCIVTMATPAEARQIVRLSGRFRINKSGPFTVEYYYSESA